MLLPPQGRETSAASPQFLPTKSWPQPAETSTPSASSPNPTLTSAAPCGLTAQCPAHGAFVDAINSTGWSELKIKTNSSFDPVLQSYAAGFLEGTPALSSLNPPPSGAITHDRISQTYVNFASFLLRDWNGSVPDELADFMRENLKYTRARAAASEEPYWRHVWGGGGGSLCGLGAVGAGAIRRACARLCGAPRLCSIFSLTYG